MTTAREGLLDAFEDLLIDGGERSTTLDAVAARAQVSKGGLPYHFPSKNALVDGLVERLQERTDQDSATMRDAPEGAAAYYVTSSAEVDSPFDRTFLAVFRLAMSVEESATRAIQRIRGQWLELIRDDLHDDDLAMAVLLMGDGLYYNASLASAGLSEAPETEASLLRALERLRQRGEAPAE